MGNNSQYPLLTTSDSDWQLSTSHRNLLINTSTKAVAQFRNVQSISNRVSQSYEFRAIANKYLINLLAILKTMPHTSQSDCCLVSHDRQSGGLRVLIQSMEYRLSDLGTLSLQEGLYVLWQCVNGLKLIMEKYGTLDLTMQQQFIGINKNGQCKIWLNEDYFAPIEFNGKQVSQNKILYELFVLIEARMTASSGAESYNEYCRLKKQFLGQSGNFGYTFFNSLQFIKKLSSGNNFDLQSVRLAVPNENAANLNPQSMDANEEYLFRTLQAKKRKISLKVKSKRSTGMSSNDQSRHCNLSKDKNQQSSSTISRYSIIVKQQQPNHMDSPITKTLNSSFYSDYNNSNNNDNSNGKTNSTPATTASKKIENNYGIQNRNQIYIKPQIPSTRLF